MSAAASSFRFDPLLETWVAMAPGRFAIGASRPGGLPESARRCPFCPGHEADAEEATLEVGDPWRVRVVRNRFPLVRTSARPPAESRARAASGEHEVIVEAREHELDLATMDAEQAFAVLYAWRDRVRELGAHPEARVVQLFRNRGRRAGSSQAHPHSQVLSLPFVPPLVGKRAAIAARFRASTGRSLLRHVLTEEREAQERIVADADHVVTYCPHASHRAWTTRIALDDDVPRFAAVSDEVLGVLAERVPDACRRALVASGATDYNVLVHEPPLGQEDAYFAIDVVPRTGGDAGFELSTGVGVCVVLPEEAAARLRGVGPRS
ncbi:MAG: galactose-1-phosphate uridylyltransferase [Sandaracinaceae bacterium]